MEAATVAVIIAAQQAAQQNTVRIIRKKRLKEKGEKSVTNDMLKELAGKQCNIVVNNYTTYSKVWVVEVFENWVKIDKNGQVSLINADYIQSIKLVEG